eukprot:scaffold62787_cov64-Phaeocystis_antarctica.AAC.1
MEYMFVTREVSQLSGWLKAVARCRGSQAGHTVRGGRRARRRGGRAQCARSVPGSQRAHDCRLVGGARGAAHLKHGVHVRDAGGVPVQRLVEGRALPRVASRAHGAGRAAGQEAAGGRRSRRARSVQGGGH